MDWDSFPPRASQTADADAAEGAERRGSLPAPTSSSALLHRDITKAILGAFYSVYSELGFGFLELVYVNALVVVLKAAGLKVQEQVPFDIMFHGHLIGHYRADLVVEKRVVVEVKTSKAIIPQYSAQLLNYLKASHIEVGLLLHFGDKPAFRRVVLTRNNPRSSASSA